MHQRRATATRSVSLHMHESELCTSSSSFAEHLAFPMKKHTTPKLLAGFVLTPALFDHMFAKFSSWPFRAKPKERFGCRSVIDSAIYFLVNREPLLHVRDEVPMPLHFPDADVSFVPRNFCGLPELHAV